jgi:hypothetical protein
VTRQHRHHFKVWGYSGRRTLELCSCGDKRERPQTKAESKKLRDEFKEASDVHKTWHAFAKKFIDRKTEEFLYVGYDLMTRAERWAEKYPEIKIVGCDDDHFCCSSLILVPHATARSYMGLTVLYIPQCTGEKPICFFLYPSHRQGLLDALGEIAREHGKKKGWRR